MTERLRNLTSGDNVFIDVKHGPVFHAKVYCKLIIASNSAPQITTDQADSSRLLRIDVARNVDNTDDPDWAKRLEKELPQFLYDCRLAYQAKCPKHGKIYVDKSTETLGVQSMTANDEAIDILEEHFIKDPNGFVPSHLVTEVFRANRSIHPEAFKKELSKMGGNYDSHRHSTHKGTKRGWKGIRRALDVIQ